MLFDSANRFKKKLFKKTKIYNESDDQDGEITAINKTVLSSKVPAQKKTTQANVPGSSDYQLAKKEDNDDDKRSNSSHGSQRHRNRVNFSRDSHQDQDNRSGRNSARLSRYQNEYHDEVDEAAGDNDAGERFPMPSRKPILYTTSVNTSSDQYSNTLDISTRIKLTQV